MGNPELTGLPFVSIVTPSYNSMPYLEENIRSVLNQSYPDIEHIIIDGGSTDGSIDILKSYSHLNWVSEKDNGQSHALNKGFRRATGEIIGWLNSDDTYNPGAIESTVVFFYENPDIDLLFTDINIIDGNSKIIGLSKGGEFDLQRILTFNMIKQPSLFMRRNVIDELSGVNEELHYVMDQELWLRAGIKGFKFFYLKEAEFANFRLIPGTKSFESATLFNTEWHNVVTNYLTQPCFHFLNPAEKKRIKNQTKASIYVSNMVKSLNERNKHKMFSNFLKSIKTNPTILINSGIWKFLIYGMVGQENDKLHKFQ